MPLGELNKAYGAQFVAFLLDEDRPFGAKTASNHGSYISALLNAAVKDDWLDRNLLDLTFDETIGAQLRKPWIDDELTQMCGHTLFSDRMDDVPEWPCFAAYPSTFRRARRGRLPSYGEVIFRCGTV